MKIAFISDIHGNAVALESVLEDIDKKNVDRIIVLGDICFRGPEPKRSLDLVRSLDTYVIKGNADEWIYRGIKPGEVPDKALDIMRLEKKWALKQLTIDDVEYLGALPKQITTDLTNKLKIHAFHATPDSLFEVVKPSDSDETLITKLMCHQSADIFLYGHIHLPFVRFINGKCIANLGSVGLPFDGINQSSYIIVEGEGDNFNISIQRVKYDVEKVIKQLYENEYPNLELMENIIKKGTL
ncbi:metallophosphoesterase [Sporosarcina pasteurii]|uniref:Phosphodiesterase n=1 Tax=Sporosarcina pasteurii TaxID=1474 RepID=A0A380BCX7_SPOPA|nr:metallophosphoesterase family protein [Sporosarcina pasteurii]MDS9472209.1 metallophosphoesterase family protein [Sporosarcina pasteurii]QBQ06195.1 metallophosphoesterase [Sporosarcina pasteurii]SUI99198.1 phosphodiesterase [Sporosarcina pasteurii]